MIKYNNFSREIKATPNYSKRTFTLREVQIDRVGIHKTKYRTHKMNKEEFENCLYNTERDWFNFLKTDEYYLIK